MKFSSTKEKKCGILRKFNLMKNFRDTFDDCDFIDLGYVGNTFTRCKK